MNVLVFSSIFPPNIFGGAEIAAHSLACLLVRRGHQVSVATICESGEDEVWGELQEEGFRLYRVRLPRAYTLFSRGKHKSFFVKTYWHLQDLFDCRNKSVVRRVLDHANPDLIDIHNIMGFGFNALKTIGEFGVPVKYYLHDLGLSCFHASMFKNGINCEHRCAQCKVVGFFRQKAVSVLPILGFVAPSPVPFDRLKAFVPILSDRPCAVIRNAPERIDCNPIVNESNVVRLLYVGRLDAVKGIDFLLSVLSKISSQYNFRIDVLGTGPLESELKNRYASSDWCFFHGFVSSEYVLSYTAAADLFCMPSLWLEVYGLVTAQALRLGVPVVGSRIGGTVHLVKDGITGMLLDPGVESDWINAFSFLLSDRNQLEKLKRGANEHMNEFCDDSIGEAYEAFSKRLGEL